DRAGRRRDTTSAILPAPVKSDGNEDLSAPQPAAATNLREPLPAAPVLADSSLTSEPDPSAPSPNDPTRTTAPGAATMPGLGRPADLRRSGPSQLRDPERYQIIGEHGRGGLGRVARAHDHDLGRDI